MDADRFKYVGKIIESLHPGVTIVDSYGNFQYIGKKAGEFFRISSEEIIGKNVFSQQIQTLFNPCVSAIVLEKKEKVVTRQKNIDGTETMVTGIPIFSDEKNLDMVVSISSWEISTYEELKASYNNLKEEIEKLTLKYNRLAIGDTLNKNVLENSRMFFNSERLLKIFAENGLSSYVFGQAGSGRKYLARTAYSTIGLVYSYNCELLDDALIDEELFSENGLLTEDSKDVLIIENVDSLTAAMQKKLIYAIDKGGRVVVAVSEKSLDELRKEGRIITEFYDYFYSYQVKVDPISQRPEDLNCFISFYLEYYNKKYSRKINFSPQALNAMLSFGWIGNIPEVRNTIERIVLTNLKEKVNLYDLPEDISKQYNDVFNNNETLKDMMEFYEKTIILRTFEKYKTTVEVARQLGISQPSATRKIQKYTRNSKED